jgi:hypothetical protein
MRIFLFRLLLGCLVASVLFAAPQSHKLRETIWLGSEDLTLGMSEGAILTKLAESYNLEKGGVSPALRAKGVPYMWVASAKVKRGDHGALYFASGTLVAVSKSLPERDDVEFGRQLYFAMRDLELEGDSHCAIETDNLEGPDFANKRARLRCGKKSLVIQVQKLKAQDETTSLGEELEAVPLFAGH